MTGDKDFSTPAPTPQRLSSMPIGLARSEQTAVQAKFGVSAEQVRRDHLISHLLGALARMDDKKGLVFFGGTALSRTLLPDLRLAKLTKLIEGKSGHLLRSRTRALYSGDFNSTSRSWWSPSSWLH